MDPVVGSILASLVVKALTQGPRVVSLSDPTGELATILSAQVPAGPLPRLATSQERSLAEAHSKFAALPEAQSFVRQMAFAMSRGTPVARSGPLAKAFFRVLRLHDPKGETWLAPDDLFEALRTAVALALAESDGAPDLPPSAGFEQAATSLAATAHLITPAGVEAIFAWETAYRQQVVAVHGTVDVPNIDGHAPLPIDAIYVAPHLRAVGTDAHASLAAFRRRMSREVVLGSPGAGKSTLAAKLTSELAIGGADDPLVPTPFIVKVRSLEDRLLSGEQSIVGYLAHSCEHDLQMPAPPKHALEYLFVVGRGLVIFDGLDELVDVSLRRAMTKAITAFCSAYPHTAVLVTARLIGYETAPLPEPFSIWHLAPFDQPQVREYVEKWFSLPGRAAGGSTPREISRAFMEESRPVDELRRNALLLALMCSLYRGRGHIPQNRPDIYEACADLLFVRWDAQRRIAHGLPFSSRAQLRNLLRSLAWLRLENSEFADGIPRRAALQHVAEELGRSTYEGVPDEAEDAAGQFLDFCRGRAWVLTEVGERRNDQVYDFVHRTFAEFFAAEYLAWSVETFAALLDIIKRRIADGGGDVMCQLAVQIRNQKSPHTGSELVQSALVTLRGATCDTPRAGGVSASGSLAFGRFAARCLTFLLAPRDSVREFAYTLCHVTSRADAMHYTEFESVLDDFISVSGDNRAAVQQGIAEFISSGAALDPDEASRLRILDVAVLLNMWDRSNEGVGTLSGEVQEAVGRCLELWAPESPLAARALVGSNPGRLIACVKQVGTGLLYFAPRFGTFPDTSYFSVSDEVVNLYLTPPSEGEHETRLRRVTELSDAFGGVALWGLQLTWEEQLRIGRMHDESYARVSFGGMSLEWYSDKSHAWGALVRRRLSSLGRVGLLIGMALCARVNKSSIFSRDSKDPFAQYAACVADADYVGARRATALIEITPEHRSVTNTLRFESEFFRRSHYGSEAFPGHTIRIVP